MKKLSKTVNNHWNLTRNMARLMVEWGENMFFNYCRQEVYSWLYYILPTCKHFPDCFSYRTAYMALEKYQEARDSFAKVCPISRKS